MNHDPDAPDQMTSEPSAGTLVRSIYFFDPDGILLEFAGWTRALPAGSFAVFTVELAIDGVPWLGGAPAFVPNS